jgi:AcrR family transcriptional regulator
MSSRDRAMRAAQILDVTAELLLRFGYRRITIEDIAEHADIGKGTVYLHWKTREELFGAVFEREVLRALDELLDTLRHEPEAWRPHRLARSYFLGIMTRPLLAACFLGDAEVLGKLAKPGSSPRESRHRLVSHDYFQLLADHGLLRDDLSPDAVAYGFMATLEGFIQAEADDLLARAELLALIIQRAFETGRAVSAAEEKAIATQVVDLFAGLGAADRADLGIGEN